MQTAKNFSVIGYTLIGNQVKLESFASESGLQNKSDEGKAIFERKEVDTSLNLPKDKSSGFI